MGIHVKREPLGFTYSMESKIDSITDELPTAVSRLPCTRVFPVSTAHAQWHDATFDSLSTNEAHCLRNYRHLVGSINYLSTTIRSDITLAMSLVSTHLNDPTPYAAKLLYQLIRYLYTTKERCLELHIPTMRQHEQDERSLLEIWSDSNFADDTDARFRATSGTVVTWRGRPIQWKSKLQKLTAQSTHDAELYALHQSNNLALEFRNLMEELGLGDKRDTTPIYVDNAATSFTASNAERITARNRHLSVRYFKVCDHVASGEVRVDWLPGSANPSDLFTKPLGMEPFTKHANFLLQGTPYDPESSGSGGVQNFLDLPSSYSNQPPRSNKSAGG